MFNLFNVCFENEGFLEDTSSSVYYDIDSLGFSSCKSNLKIFIESEIYIFIINILVFLILILIFLCIDHIKITKVRSLKRVLLISLILINIFDWISFRISFNTIKLNSINNFDFLLFVLRFYIILYNLNRIFNNFI